MVRHMLLLRNCGVHFMQSMSRIDHNKTVIPEANEHELCKHPN